MADKPPTHYTIFQGLGCPECMMQQSHIRDIYSSTGINAFGRSEDRLGVKILFQCESGHAYIVGFGNHKGDAFAYVRLPLGGEVEESGDYYDGPDSLPSVRFTGKHDFAWHPKATQDPEVEYQMYPMPGGLSLLDTGVWA